MTKCFIDEHRLILEHVALTGKYPPAKPIRANIRLAS
jgi:hypothetical protein